mgnify:FL=1
MRRWYVVQRAGRFVSPATAAFVQFVVENAPALLAEAVPADAAAIPSAAPPRQTPSKARASAAKGARGTSG